MKSAAFTILLTALLLTGCTESGNSEETATAKSGATGDDGDLPQIFEPTTTPEYPPGAVLTAADLSSARIELAPATLLDNKVTIQLPTIMNPMTEEQLEVQYQGSTRPELALTDPTTAVDLTMTHTSVNLQPLQIYEYHFHFKSELKKSPNTKNAQWVSNEEVTVDSRPCFLSQFRNQLTDQEVYNMVLGVSVEDRLLLVTINFPTALEDTWLEIAKEMLLTADFHGPAERAGAGASASP